METVAAISAMLGVGWASGINLYAAILTLGFMAHTGTITLPEEMVVVTSPWVMIAAGLMYGVEFFADKIPGVDSLWDAIHSFIRIPAGAMLAAGAATAISPDMEMVGLLLGGSLAAGSHFTKAGTRMLVNTSPEPFSNAAVSVTEDVAVFAGVWAAFQHPVAFLILLGLAICGVIWLAPKLWRGIKRVFARIGRLFGREQSATDSGA